MSPGDAFYLRDRKVNDHLFVNLSDPGRDPDRVLIVYMTTYEAHQDDACRLASGDHPRISHDTCIAHADARLASMEQLTKLRDAGELIDQPPVSPEILARILAGASRSGRIKFKHVEFLLDQGMIE